MEYWKDEELTDDINDKINKCEDLEQLFKEWKKAQQTIITKTNCLKNTGYFVKDGYINEKAYKESKVKILFILKEAHILNETNKKNKVEIKDDKQKYFYNDFFEQYTDKNEMIYKVNENNVIVPVAYVNRATHYKYFDNKPKQKEKIARMAEYIFDNKIKSDYSDLCKALKQVAFLNINKMGGTNRTNSKELKLYYQKYKKFILNEIKILEPDVIIVMCGIDDITEDLNKIYIGKTNKKIMKMLHTAARGRNLNFNSEKELYYYQQYKNNNFYEGTRTIC